MIDSDGIIVNVQAPHLELDILSVNLTVRKCNFLCQLEHRVFCHVARVIKGVFIRSLEEFKNLVARAKTKTGLQVTVNEIDGAYKTGAKGLKEDWDGSIIFEEILPKWNYSCLPVC